MKRWWLVPLVTAVGMGACSVSEPHPTVAQGGAGAGGKQPSGPEGGDRNAPGTSGVGASQSAGGADGSSEGGGGPGDGGETGRTDAGGAPTAGDGNGGSAGSSAGTSGSSGNGPVTVDEILSGKSDFGNPGWKESWWVKGCADKSNHDCLTVPACPSVGATPEDVGARTVEVFPVGGKPGQRYKVTFRYSAITEGRAYVNGKRDGGLTVPLKPLEDNWDSFYRDGNSPVSNYDVYKLSVFDEDGLEVRHFYMNSFPDQGYEGHLTYHAQYTKSIVIVGGGTIQHLLQDRNCHSIDNCNDGEVTGYTCTAPRSLPAPDGTALLPPNYLDPNDGMVKSTPLLAAAYPQQTRAQPWHAQAAKLTVLSIEATSDPVTKDY